MLWAALEVLVAVGQRLLGTAVAVGLRVLIYLAVRQERAPRFEALVPVQGQAQNVRVGPVRGRSPAMWFELTVRQPGGSGTYRFRAASGDAAAQRAQVAGGRDPVTVWVEPGFSEAASTPVAYQIMLGAGWC